MSCTRDTTLAHISSDGDDVGGGGGGGDGDDEAAKQVARFARDPVDGAATAADGS